MVETMAYAGETPWHGLGKPVHNDLTPNQMLVEAGLDWTVNKVPAFVKIGGKMVHVGKDALVRSSDDKILDVVSSEWNPVQNSDAFEFFTDFVMEGDMEMHTAGSLRGGQVVWALAKIKDSFELFGGDRVDGYLLFTNPHRFGQCIDVRFTPIRVVCNNTLTLSLNEKNNRFVKVNHRRQFDADSVKQTLGIAGKKLTQYKEMASFLGSKRYDETSLEDYFKGIFPVLTTKEKARKELSKSAQRALEVVDTQPGYDFARGTWWQAYNAVTYLTDHEIGRSNDNRLTSAWFGPNSQLKVRALESAIEYAEAA
jgi:phage/plasmid-like protein (TIGR03299 family)